MLRKNQERVSNHMMRRSMRRKSLEERLWRNTKLPKVCPTFCILTVLDLSTEFTEFAKEIVVKPESHMGPFNFICFPSEKAPEVDWLSAHLLPHGLFFVSCRTFDLAYKSVNLFKSHFHKLTEYHVHCYRGQADSSTAFKLNTVILQVWGFKRRILELAKLDRNGWTSDEDLKYLCK